MAAHAYAPEIDSDDSPRGPQQLLQSHQCNRPRGRAMGSPLHSNILGSRVPQQSRDAGTHRGLDQAGESHEELPPPPPLLWQPTPRTMAHGPPRNSAETPRPHTKPREGNHENAGVTPAAGPRPTGYPPLFPNQRASSPSTSSHAKMSTENKEHSRP